MAEGSIDRLAIEVSGDASAATKGINRLVTALGKLERGIDAPASKLGRLQNAVRQLSNAVSGLNVSKLQQLRDLKVSASLSRNLVDLGAAVELIPSDTTARIGALSGLSSVGSLKVPKSLSERMLDLGAAIELLPEDTDARLRSLSPLAGISYVTMPATLGKNLKTVAEAVRQIPLDAGERLRPLAESLLALRDLQGVSIGTPIKNLAKLPDALKAFEDLDVDAFAEAFRKLNSELLPLTQTVEKLAAAVKELPPSWRSAGAAARTVASSQKYLAAQAEAAQSKVKALSQRLLGLIDVAKIVAGLKLVASKVVECTKAVSDYIEDMNLFAASMGEFTDEATGFATTVQALMGIDAGEWSRFQGVLMSIGTGFGIASDRMATMSQNMTQLGYDIASFYNLDVDEAMRKVQSGFAGELEPMRRIGYDLSVARMEIEATNLGIEKQVSDMTQAEKAALRYHLMMTQLTQVHGDMARTINSPANQLRVLKAQFTMAARAVGNVFIPMLNAILPYAIAAAKAIQILANTIARFFGIDASFEVDYSGLDTSGIAADTSGLADLADATENAGDSASDAKKKVEDLKRSVMGFDELNKLTDASSSDTGGSGGSGSGASTPDLGSVMDQIPLDTYDFLAGLDDYLTEVTDELAEKMIGLLPYIAAVAGGLAAWKIADALLPDTSEGIKRFKKLAGVAMTVAGAILYVSGVWGAWVNGMDLGNTLQILGGMALIIGGLALAFGPVAAGFGALVTGVGLFATAVHDAVTNGINWFNTLGMVVGGVVAVLGSFFAGLTGPVTAFIGVVSGGIMVVMGFADAWNNGVDWQNLALMVGGTAVAALGLFMGGLFGVLGPIALLAGGIALVVASFRDFLQNGPSLENTAGMVAGIMAVAGAFAVLVGWPALVVGAVVAAVAAIVMNWDSVRTFLEGLWSNITSRISEVWGGVATWFDTNVVTPVRDFFQNLGSDLDRVWQDAVASVQTWWSVVGPWLDENVVQPIISLFTPLASWFSQLWSNICATAEALWHNIGVLAQGCWQIITALWSVASQWFNQNVVQPVAQFFANLWAGIQYQAQVAWYTVQIIWAIVANWYNQNVVVPVTRFFTNLWTSVSTGAQQAWQAIQNAFSSMATWLGEIFTQAWNVVKGVFAVGGQAVSTVIGALSDAFKWLLNGVIGGFNSAMSVPFSWLNSMLLGLKYWQISIGGWTFQPFSGFVTVPVPSIPYLAEGGQVTSGQLFMARENGITEMVGQMGGKATVANNDQIVEGIEGGVMRGVLQALAMGGSQGREQVIEIPLIIGNREIARASYRGRMDLVRSGEISPEFA